MPSKKSRTQKRLDSRVKVHVPVISLGQANPKSKPKTKAATKAKSKSKAKVVKPVRAPYYGNPPADQLPDPVELPIELPGTLASPIGSAAATGTAQQKIVPGNTPEPESQELPGSEQAAPSLTPAPGADVPVTTGMPTDRLLQGTGCTWIGTRAQTLEDSATGKPICPYCGGRLTDSVDRATMELGLEQYELGVYSSINPAPRPHPGYKKMVLWMTDQNECWPMIEIAAMAYEEATGVHVDPAR